MKKILILAAAAAILIPLGMWWFSTEQVVKRRTNHLMEVLSMSEGAGPLRQGKVYSMNAMLAPQVTLTIPGISDANGTFDKQEMESAFSWICQNAKKSDFQIDEFREIEIDGETAEVRIIVTGFLELRAGGRPADGTFDVTLRWVKGGDGWRYDAVTWKNL